jgi:sugar phosphate isomerase/epimerase
VDATGADALSARIGLMLYTVREDCAHDFEATLREVASIGYEGVELFDLHGCEAAQVADWLEDTGLTACGRHTSLDGLEGRLPELAAEAKQIGWGRLVLSWADPAELSADLVVRLRKLASLAAGHGLEFGYHNHHAEVAPLDGGASFLELLLDDGSLFLELDLGWAWYAGVDPVLLLEHARGRCPLIHVKDFHSRAGPEFSAVGDGLVDYEHVIPAAVAAGAEWLLVEQDQTDGPALEAARRSFAAVSADRQRRADD